MIIIVMITVIAIKYNNDKKKYIKGKKAIPEFLSEKHSNRYIHLFVGILVQSCYTVVQS